MEIWNSFNDELDRRLNHVHIQMEQTIKQEDLFRLQGEAKALRRLKKLINNDGLMKTLKSKEYYEKPSEIKQRKKAEAKKRWQKKLKKLEKLGIVN